MTTYPGDHPPVCADCNATCGGASWGPPCQTDWCSCYCRVAGVADRADELAAEPGKAGDDG